MQTNIYIPIDTQINKSVYCSKLIKRGDILTLQLKIFNNGVLADLTGQTIDLILKKSDNTLIEKTITNIADGVITAQLDIQATVVAGVVQCEAQIRDANGQTSTNTFSFIVQNSIADDVLAKSQDDIEVIQDIRAMLQKYDAEVKVIGGTTNQIEQLNNVKDYIDTNLPNLQNENSKAAANNNILQSSITTAKNSKNELDNTNNTANNKTVALQQEITIAEDKLDEFRLYDPNNLIKQVQDNSSQLLNIQQQVLSNTFTKISTDSNLTKLESVKDGFVDGMIIEGKTLQNIWDNSKSIYFDSNYGGRIRQDYTLKEIYKQNVIYTVINYSNKKITLDIDKQSGEYSRTLPILASSKVTFTLTDEFVYVKIGYLSDGWENTDVSKNEFKKSIMILEGDYTNKEIPSYFEGIKSVGELNDNKIEVLTHGKNLWDGTYQKAFIGTENRKTYINDDTCRLTIIKCKTSTNYIVSKQSESDRTTMACFNEFPVNNSVATKSIISDKILTDINSKYLVVYVSQNREEPLIQIEEGTESTAYEEPKTDKSTILIKEPVKGLPNGVCDKIDIEKDEVIRNVGKIVLNGSENWSVVLGTSSNRGDNTVLFSIKPLLLPKTSYAYNFKNVINNRFACKEVWRLDEEGTYVDEVLYFISISKSKLTPCGFKDGDTSTYTSALRAWLQANPVEAYYQLATPVIEKLDTTITPLKTFQDGYIELDNAITPIVSFNYSTDLSSIIGKTTEIVDSLADRIASLESLVLTHIADIS